MSVRSNLCEFLALAVCCFANAIPAAAQRAEHHIDLRHWKLTLPVDAAGTMSGKAAEISARQLASGYTHSKYFRRDADGTMVFWCPVNGARTEGTKYPRCELREVLDPDNDKVAWPARGTHVLTATCRVAKVPSSQKVIIGQIHGHTGQARPLIKLQFFKGRIEALVRPHPEKDQEQKLAFRDVGLNQDIHYQIKLDNGLLTIVVNDIVNSVNIFDDAAGWENEACYFKAGAYCQDNEGPATEGALVLFTAIETSH